MSPRARTLYTRVIAAVTLGLTALACDDRIDTIGAPSPRVSANAWIDHPLCGFAGDWDNWILTQHGCETVDSSFRNQVIRWVGAVDEVRDSTGGSPRQLFAMLEYRYPKAGGFGVTVSRLQPVIDNGTGGALGGTDPYYVDVRLSEELAGVKLFGFVVGCADTLATSEQCFEQAIAVGGRWHYEPGWCIDNQADTVLSSAGDPTFCGGFIPHGNRNPVGRIRIASDAPGTVPSTRRVTLSADGTTDRDGIGSLSYSWTLSGNAIPQPIAFSVRDPDLGDLPYGRYAVQLKVRDGSGGFDFAEADILVSSGATSERRVVTIAGPGAAFAAERVTYHLTMRPAQPSFAGFWTLNGNKIDQCARLFSCTITATGGTMEVSAYHRYGPIYSTMTASDTVVTIVP